MAVTADRQTLRQKQIQQAEELLASVPQKLGVAKGLFWGKFVADWVFPYPTLASGEQNEVELAVADVVRFCDDNLDPASIDRCADIPREVIEGLANLGVLGMTAPRDVGGRGFSQMSYGKVLESLGARCSATSIFVNAHHSIGMRALLLFGTDEQKRRWLPDLVSGRKLAAFALTEDEAGSDAANVQTSATPSADGSHFVLNGSKRYITNGDIADVLTVMARTPIPGREDSAVTAFLVTREMAGFHVTEARMEKLGIRGTATSKLSFDNLKVPAGNILGQLGKGLKVALTVLDFGRATFGACCTGTAKTCLQLAVEHARSRRQFGRPLAEFELVQEKLARIAAWTYAIEAMTVITSSLIDRGLEDYMLETAMLKVYSTERLWTIVNDTFQIYGGAAYFTDKPLERILRDARINQIGEGANEVLLSFIALTGMRGPGHRLKDISDSLRRPWKAIGPAYRLTAERMAARLTTPMVPAQDRQLRPYGRRLAKLVRQLGRAVQSTLIRYREDIIERQLVQERLAWAAMELFASACVLSRQDHELNRGGALVSDGSAAATYFLEMSLSNAASQLASLNSPLDDSLRGAARAVIRQ